MDKNCRKQGSEHLSLKISLIRNRHENKLQAFVILDCSNLFMISLLKKINSWSHFFIDNYFIKVLF